MPKSTRRRHSAKPDKPYPDFPLPPHVPKRWAKEIRGRMIYFGTWDEAGGALNRFLEQKDDLYAGRVRRQDREGFTLADLCDSLLNYKRHALDTRELALRTWQEYQTPAIVIDEWG